MDTNIFKACDIRGIAGKDLTEKVSFLIGRAIGTIIRGAQIVVAGDVRSSTPTLMASLIQGLKNCGCTVINIGIVPTPVYYFAKRILNIDPGVMVTASHNPPEFNGFKPTIGKLPITEAEVQQIYEIAVSGKFIDGTGYELSLDVLPQYREFIASRFRIGEELNEFGIVVDCGNGCYSDIAPSILKEIGYNKLYPLFCTPDGSFPNRSPNSAIASNLAALSSKVVETKADLGIAFDGDGDRVSYVDNKGRMLSADKCIVIFLQIFGPQVPNSKIVYDIKCSLIVPQSIKKLGGIPLEERSGHTFIKTRMIKEDALFGGEISGHYFHRALGGGDDGLYSSLIMAGYLAESGISLSDIADSVPEYTITPDIRIPYEGDGSHIIEKIAAHFPADMISRIDGVKVQFSDGWGLARVSVTEPVITLRFEATSNDRILEIIDRFLEPVQEIRNAVISKLELQASSK